MVKLYPEFFNDVYGPIMQPGSSSHMAGPCRVGLLAHSILGEDVAKILIELDTNGSIAATLGHMNEDLGMLNGAAGRAVDHPDFFNILSWLKEHHIPWDIRIDCMQESLHLNAIKYTLTGKSGKVVTLVGNSIGGGMVETVWVNGYHFSGKGDTYVLFVVDQDKNFDATALSKTINSFADVLEEGVSEGKDEGIAYWFKVGTQPSPELIHALGNKPYMIMAPVLPVLTTRAKKEQLFDSMVKWRQLAAEQGKPLSEVAIDYEVAASGWTREEVIRYMKDVVFKTMHRRVYAVAKKEVLPQINPLTQQPTYQRMADKAYTAPLFSPLMARSLHYVFSARVAHPGILNVPGPMGSGGGFLAGVLFAIQEELGLDDSDVLRGIFVGAGVGAICYTRSAPTGEELGCTGECGCCTAMTAAAIVEMLHGTPEQVESAATLALHASIGWPCDAIPGGKGMPCGSRIMFVAIMSIVYAQTAMLGEEAVVPFHEALDAADKTAKDMGPDYHTTNRGGMCICPTAIECAQRLKEWREHRS
jgi:L-serine dehydratase